MGHIMSRSVHPNLTYNTYEKKSNVILMFVTLVRSSVYHISWLNELTDLGPVECLITIWLLEPLLSVLSYVMVHVILKEQW